jgi:hypothetical protein
MRHLPVLHKKIISKTRSRLIVEQVGIAACSRQVNRGNHHFSAAVNQAVEAVEGSLQKGKLT